MREDHITTSCSPYEYSPTPIGEDEEIMEIEQSIPLYSDDDPDDFIL